MVKDKSVYICQQCSYESYRWLGKCPECGSWGSLVETSISHGGGTAGKSGSRKTSVVKPLSEIRIKKADRVIIGIPEFDRVLGGGIIPGQVVLIAGEPGIGKSTLLLQTASKLAKSKVLYVSGEESSYQIKTRAERLKITHSGILMMEETDIDSVISTIESYSQLKRPKFLIIDSIQTMSTSDLSGMPGSVGQVRECTYRLIRYAKKNSISVFIVGHITKEGSVAGPAVLTHLVDTVLWFEGEQSLTLRILRAFKNRFGPTDEVGIFSMEEKGLVSESNPEKLFMTDLAKSVPGSVLTSVMRGTRPILVELQTLINPTKLAYPRRIAQGIDAKRFELMIAVLQRRCNIPLYEYDCYVNVSGGMNLKNEPSADLALCLCLASSFSNKPLSAKTVVIGEVGLLGDVRTVAAQEKRIKEARRIGYKNIITSTNASGLQQAIKKYIK